mgnify:CR=1 FL=1
MIVHPIVTHEDSRSPMAFTSAHIPSKTTAPTQPGTATKLDRYPPNAEHTVATVAAAVTATTPPTTSASRRLVGIDSRTNVYVPPAFGNRVESSA